ncbi:MAG: hypothetical protein WCQ53_03630 [bacterium]
MKKLLLVLSCAFFLVNCGNTNRDPVTLFSDVNSKVDYLQSVTGMIGSLVQSEYASCSNSGDLASNTLLRKICAVAQSATAEMQIQLSDQLGIMQNNLQAQIDQIKSDLADESITLSQRVDAANASIASINTDLTSLEGRMTSAENAIAAINDFNDAVDLPNSMKIILIGSDNASAGPVYEAVAQRKDKGQYLGFVERLFTTGTIDNNGLASTSGSSTITVNAANHGLNTNDFVTINGSVVSTSTGIITGISLAAAGNGYTTGDIITIGGGGNGATATVTAAAGNVIALALTTAGNGYVVSNSNATTGAGSGCKVNITSVGYTNLLSSDFNGKMFLVTDASDPNSFKISVSRVSTFTTLAFGGAGMTFNKVTSRQMEQIWQTSDPQYNGTTTSGSYPYNFIIKTDGSLCYDKVIPSQTYANIAAGGANIVCK